MGGALPNCGDLGVSQIVRVIGFAGTAAYHLAPGGGGLAPIFASLCGQGQILGEQPTFDQAIGRLKIAIGNRPIGPLCGVEAQLKIGVAGDFTKSAIHLIWFRI